MKSEPINIYIQELQEQKDTALLYGQFIEHALDCIDGGIFCPKHPLADELGIREDVTEKIRQIQPPVLRFPGGTIMCQYHWEDAVGPMQERIWRKNLIWGGELDPSFGTAEFIMLCRKTGAEPMICVNMESGTPEEAGNWVEYCNGTGNSYYANLRRRHGYEEPFHVKYWCIGNESYSEYDMGIHHDVNAYTRDAMEFIKRMKLTDSSIQTVIVGCADAVWNKAVLDALHEVTDYFSLHHYSGTKEGSPYEPYDGELHFARLLDEVSDLIDSYPEQVTNFNRWYRFPPRKEKIKIAVDEWNIWDFQEDTTYGLKQLYCWRDAVWAADMLNLFINHPAVGMANMAQLVNVLAPIRTEQDSVWLQTIAYPLLHYRKYMTGTALRICCDKLPVLPGTEGMAALSVSAAETAEGICFAVVNRDVECAYTVKLYGKAGAEILPEKILVLTAEDWTDTCSKTRCCVRIDETAAGGQIKCPKNSVCFIKA